MKKTKSKALKSRRPLNVVRPLVLRRSAPRKSAKRSVGVAPRSTQELIDLPTVVAMITQAVTPPLAAHDDHEVSRPQSVITTSLTLETTQAVPPDPLEDPFAPAADAGVVETESVPAVAGLPEGQRESDLVQIFEEVAPEQQPAAPELFDAQGNLVVFSRTSVAVPQAAEVIAEVTASPDQAADFAVVESADTDVVATLPQQAFEYADALNQLDDESSAAPKMVDEVMVRQLRAVPKLTVVGLLRAAVWPVLKLVDLVTWPVRAVWLAVQRRRLRNQYGHHAESTPELVESGRVVRLWWMTLPSHWPRVMLRFIAVSMVLILPLQVTVYYQSVGNVRDGMVAQTNAAVAAMLQTQQLLREQRFGEAIAKFAQAETGLREVREQFDQLDVVTRRLVNAIPQERQMMELGMSLLSAGEGIARVGQDLGAAAEQLQSSSSQGEWPALGDVIGQLRESLAFAVPQVAAAQTELAAADVSNLPTDAAPAIQTVRAMLPEAEGSLRLLQAATESLYTVLGLGEWQRYLVVFQNPNEIRATGGFLGSYALIDVADGKVIRIEIPGGGFYDLEVSSQVRVRAPAPLRLLRVVWQIWDANWWPDFPTSARKLAEFYEHSRGPSVDGVIAINAPFLERLLAVTGPVEMADYGVTVTAENVILETQRQVELLYDREENRPKQFIANLAAQLLPRLTAPAAGQQPALLAAVTEAVLAREIQLYSAHPNVQAMVSELGASGELKSTGNGDYLAVIATNIGGEKTDGVITQHIQHRAQIANDGSVIDTVTLTRAHHGAPGETFTGAVNNAYLRFYVPEGSELLEAEGFAFPKGGVEQAAAPDLGEDVALASVEGAHDVHPVSGVETWRETKKTVFAHWLSVPPGEERTVRLRYRLPNAITEDHGIWRLYVQAQSGRRGDRIAADVEYPADWLVSDRFPQAPVGATSTTSFTGDLNRDVFFGLTFMPANP